MACPRLTTSASRSRIGVPALLLLSALCLCATPSGPTYPRLEASFGVTNLVTDPFDYTVSDVRVQLRQPGGSTISLPAFYDGGVTWRVRHAPTNTGVYQVTGVTLNGSGLTVSNLQPTSWTIVGHPSTAGYVGVDPANPSRFITGNGRRFYPLGHNVAWWTNNTQLYGTMQRLGAARENWSRIWMMQFYDSLNLEWPKTGNFGTYSLPVARKWDDIVAAAEQNGVCFQMTLQHHGQYSSTTDANWSSNPYNSANGGFLTNATLFFTDPTAKALTKRKYRYIVARWGYSPAIMAWELFNEVQFVDAANANQWTNIAAWHDEMAQFIRSQDPYRHLVTTSSQLDKQIWNQCDYYQHHDYPSDLITGLRDAAGVPAGQPVKPIFGGENGRDSTRWLGFHAPLWSGIMAGQSGASQQWYWDGVDAENAYSLFRAARDFTLHSGLGDQEAVTRSSPRVTCPVASALAFAPGGGWATASQDTFTVGDVAPNGIGSLPSFLQGQYHRSMTPNGFTFQVNYTVAGTFSAQVTTIALSGAGLTIYLDGASAASISWPNMGADTPTNYSLTINVPAGAHTIKLWNPGLDWVVLGNLTFNPYASMLAAYQVGNTNFAALWLWHRTNIYLTNASATLTGSVSVAGLNPGSYSGTWWDTLAGLAITNFAFTVTDTNAVSLPTPAILRSAAFYAGRPPQAGIIAPDLTQTLATNSPALLLPLALTNGGGLPLAWSLAITGALPVVYAALNSTQPGGPPYAWTDISVIGTDVTDTFTPLNAKNAKDEGISGPIEIGFPFPFFSGSQSPGVYSQLYLSPNGFITFSPFAGDTSANQPFPGASAPSNSIAFFWDDFDLSSAGKIYTLADPLEGAFTVQFQKAPIKGTGTNVTCQLILKSTGEILLQYRTVGRSNSCTVGLQDQAQTGGLQAVWNGTYLQSGFAVRLSPTPWLSSADNAGLVARSSAQSINLLLNPAAVTAGTYTATLVVKTADPALPVSTLPLTLNVLTSTLDQWRFDNLGTRENIGAAADNADPDHDGLANLVEYALDLDPNIPNVNPVAVSIATGHLQLVYRRPHPPRPDILYLAELTTDLAAPDWNSGPTYLTETVTDNGDATETVTVTTVDPTTATPTRYLRLRFQRL